jgi:hypothetical protein
VGSVSGWLGNFCGASEEEVSNFFAMGMQLMVDAGIWLSERPGKEVQIGDRTGGK